MFLVGGGVKQMADNLDDIIQKLDALQGDAAPPAPSMDDPSGEIMLGNFLNSLEETLQYMVTTWDVNVDALRALIVKDPKTYSQFKETVLVPYKSRLLARDDTLADELLVCAYVQLPWKTATTEEKNGLWEKLKYIVEVSAMYDVYCVVPPTMLNEISNFARSIADKIQQGKMDMASINPMSIGSELTSKLSAKDLATFSQSLMGSGTDMGALMGSMQSLLAKQRLG